MIYVVVHVSYDYYRFQNNIGATTSLDEARAIAKKAALPIFEYEEEPIKLHDSETEHIWIEQFTQ